ncbi:MAG: hypothetical protein IKB70_10075 [Bacilli bacterium]|nr:hypothetical protein [Bacilli bacterium]
MAQCKGCGADIIWIETKNNKRMPCDIKETTVITIDGRVVEGYIPHWITCPKANEFRRKSDESK